jgi:hypothetical protein
MLLISIVTITIDRTRPHTQLTSRSDLSIVLVKTNIQVVGEVGQVCKKVNYRFGSIA